LRHLENAAAAKNLATRDPVMTIVELGTASHVPLKEEEEDLEAAAEIEEKAERASRTTGETGKARAKEPREKPSIRWTQQTRDV
jgi:hypothetical protein